MNKVILVGLDAAEWSIIEPLMEAGMMPAFKSLLENGVTGKIHTLTPSFSPMLWTSIATGKLADKHQILGFLEPNEAGDGVRPVMGSSRKAKAVWNILDTQGHTCNVIGWWPSHPAEPVKGIMVSELFHKWEPNAPDWQMPEGAVWPKSIQDQVNALRVHPSAIGQEKLEIFVPNAASVNKEKDFSLAIIQTLIAESESIFNTTMWAIENTEWDFTALYFKELDEFSHHFMKFHPPQLQEVPQELFSLYNNVITAAYTMYDAMLQRLILAIPPDTTVIVVSDHGFFSDNRRVLNIPTFNGGVSAEHNPLGVFCMSGPGIKRGQTIYGASLLDIAPTILSIAGLPVGEDMDGIVLQQAFDYQKYTTTIPTWEAVFCEKNATTSYKDTFAEAEALRRLIDLGYIEKLEDDMEEQIRMTINERNYTLSLVYASTGRSEKALQLVESLYEEDMVDVRYNVDLIKYYLQSGKTVKARNILTNFKKFDISGIPNFEYLEGKILYAENRYEEALHQYIAAKEKSPKSLNVLLDSANVWAVLEKYDKALGAYQEVLNLNKDAIQAYVGISILMNKTGSYEQAIEYALDALKINNTDPSANFQIGYALLKLEEYEAAAQALETTLMLNGSISRARNILVTIYRDHIPDEQKYLKHKQVFEASRKGEIIIVSGLPRSGTSLMMQMLAKGGVEVLTDHVTKPDINNPKGYFEYEPVKKSKTDILWLEQAKGKAVKVITQLLPYLTIGYKLKVIFMERDMEEVIISQQVMLSNMKNKKTSYDVRLKETYKKHLQEAQEWAAGMNNVEYITVNYNQLIEKPEEAAAQINHFLGNYLNESEMTEAVDKNLYRTRYYEGNTKSLQN